MFAIVNFATEANDSHTTCPERKTNRKINSYSFFAVSNGSGRSQAFLSQLPHTRTLRLLPFQPPRNCANTTVLTNTVQTSFLTRFESFHRSAVKPDPWSCSALLFLQRLAGEKKKKTFVLVCFLWPVGWRDGDAVRCPRRVSPHVASIVVAMAVVVGCDGCAHSKKHMRMVLSKIHKESCVGREREREREREKEIENERKR